MHEEYRYTAFGLTLHSRLRIPHLLPAADASPPDVTISIQDLSAHPIEYGYCRIRKPELLFAYAEAGRFRVTKGSSIEIDPVDGCTEALLGAYVMGSGMGAILHQRGYLPLHGSCVTNGDQTILITGDSGAGKSTLAAEFLAHGWQLLTDDVAAVAREDTIPVVQASYPSQKLWQDSMQRYERSAKDVHSLYVDATREKFGVQVLASFHVGACPLTMLVRLLPTTAPCHIEPIEGITKVDQLLRNTYRPYMIAPEDRERHFRRCATLADKLPMRLITRQLGVSCADVLYHMLINELGEMKNG